MPDFTAPGPDAGLSSLANGLNSLAGGLFPDPSKVAQAGYYGAETYRARTQAQILQDQLAAQAALPGQINRTFGASEAAPPQAPPVAPTPTPQSHGLATWFTNLFTPGGDASNAAGTTAPQPPVASPAPDAGAPPGPNITGTNGKPIPQDDAAGPIHPASVLPPGNAQIQGGPAAANGSPATLALAQLYAIALRANPNNAEAAKGQLAAGITSMMVHNMLTHEQARDALAGLGINGMYESDQANVRSFHADQTRITTEGMSQAGQTQREGMSEGAAQRRQDTTPMITADAQGHPIVSTNAGAVGQPGYNATLDTAMGTPGNYVGRDNQPVTATPATAMQPGSGLHKQTTGDETFANEQRTVKNVVVNIPQRPGEKPGDIVTRTQAQLNAAPPDAYRIPTTGDLSTVQIQKNIGGPVSTVLGSQAVNQGLQTQPPMAKQADIDDSYKQFTSLILDDIGRRYAAGGAMGSNYNTDMATLPPALLANAQQRMAMYMRYSPEQYRSNPGSLASQVTNDMQEDGLIPKENENAFNGGRGLDRSIGLGMRNDRFVQESVIGKDGAPTGETVQKILIPALTPKGPPTSWSGRAVRGSLSGAATGQPPVAGQPGQAPAAGGGAASGYTPPGAIGVAPPGATEGQILQGAKSGVQGKVMNGYIYPTSAFQGGNG